MMLKKLLRNKKYYWNKISYNQNVFNGNKKYYMMIYQIVILQYTINGITIMFNKIKLIKSFKRQT